MNNPNGVAVSNILATGFNLWFLNAIIVKNAVGMIHNCDRKII